MNESNPAEQLRELIRCLERKLGVLKDYQFSCCHITLAQCHALVEIGRSGEIPLHQLAQVLNLDNSTMSRTVNHLVNSCLVRREIDPDDRRCVLISLTEEGKRLYMDIEGRMNAYYGDVYTSLPTEKREQVLESLQLLAAAMGENCCQEVYDDPGEERGAVT